ncbi:TetR/AcrR family transcriptional regulator [Streptomyces gardneri]|uniref:TetR/AcrR family transcriptional regulator n=1 Tax=Nocardia TaxID=1817 RepID=UPI00135AA6A3|nr:MULTISPECIES: TetR/AcrR family transcriptional regulator [Nocardia]MBF6168537.1 TetR/AcrR family transcriptional regulator [Streptomyces gardneri]MBF6207799.1 TetR/AcrR family transcriptional regulator [Streptomyces gardneri]
MSEKPKQLRGIAVRDKLVGIATELFYDHGVRAIGVDEVVRRAGMAKASLYRWFPTKDDLVLAVLQRRDDNFWAKWDATAARYADARSELDAQLAWIQELATREGYRGCAFVNTAAEFSSEQSERIRQRCAEHEHELARRLRALTARLDVTDDDRLADQLHLAIVGAFAVGGIYPTGGPAVRLEALAEDLISRARAGR